MIAIVFFWEQEVSNRVLVFNVSIVSHLNFSYTLAMKNNITNQEIKTHKMDSLSLSKNV